MSILNYFPKGLTPRPEQAELLLKIEAAWDTHDVFSCVLPTGAGKTEVSLCIAEWRAAKRESTNILPPNNMLVEQTYSRYPAQFTVLHKRDAYRCSRSNLTCAEQREIDGLSCANCAYARAHAAARGARIRLMNYYTYLANNSGDAKRKGHLYATNAIFDEAHQVVEMLADLKEFAFRKSEYNFPTNLKTVADVIEWLQAAIQRGHDPKLHVALREIKLVEHSALVIYRELRRAGRQDTMLCVVPASPSAVPQFLWPASKVRKIVLLSATLSKHDLFELGLSNKRVAYLECGSPIPPERRPVVYEPFYNLGAGHADMALAPLTEMIRSLLHKHPEKGLVHLPYSVAAKVAERLNDPRLLFHTQQNKQEVLGQFRAAAPESGMVLVASGLYEGLDLPYDAARWQLVGKVPYLSLGDPRIIRKAEENPDWYQWEAIKRVLQAAGRIVRAPDDAGITYIFDTNFARLWDADKHRHTPLFPKFFRDAMHDLRSH